MFSNKITNSSLKLTNNTDGASLNNSVGHLAEEYSKKCQLFKTCPRLFKPIDWSFCFWDWNSSGLKITSISHFRVFILNNFSAKKAKKKSADDSSVQSDVSEPEVKKKKKHKKEKKKEKKKREKSK